MLLSDGSVLSLVSIYAAQEAGADVVIAVAVDVDTRLRGNGCIYACWRYCTGKLKKTRAKGCRYFYLPQFLKFSLD